MSLFLKLKLLLELTAIGEQQVYAHKRIMHYVRSEEKKSAHVFVCITRIMLGSDKNQ